MNETTTVTGYAAAMLINALIEQDGLNRSPIKPQMVYQYIKSGKIATVTENGKVKVSLIEVKKFYETVIMKNADATRPKISNLLDEINNI